MKRRAWTKEEMDIVVEMYPDHYASEIGAILNRSISSVYFMVNKLGLKAPKEKIIRSGKLSSSHPNVVANRFKKGFIPFNKGKKMSAEQYAKSAPTMFKKGNTPVNHRPVGSERVNVDGYVEIKVAEPNKWRLKHRVVWEESYGPIPKGSNIQFKNGNKQDLSLENLYIITRIDQMKNENSFLAKYPKELQQVIRLKGAINRQINKRKRNEQQH